MFKGKKLITMLVVCLLSVVFTGCGEKEKVSISGWYQPLEELAKDPNLEMVYINIDEAKQTVVVYDQYGDTASEAKFITTETGIRISDGSDKMDWTIADGKITVADEKTPSFEKTDANPFEGYAKQFEGKWNRFGDVNQSLKIENNKYKEKTRDYDGELSTYEGTIVPFKSVVTNAGVPYENVIQAEVEGEGAVLYAIPSGESLFELSQYEDKVKASCFTKEELKAARVESYVKLTDLMNSTNFTQTKEDEVALFHLTPYGFIIATGNDTDVSPIFQGTWALSDDTHVELTFSDGEKEVIDLEKLEDKLVIKHAKLTFEIQN